MRVRFAPSPSGQLARRQRAHGVVQLAARPRRRSGSSFCASRTPTSSDRPPSPRERSSATCAGSGSIGTRGRTSAERAVRIAAPNGSTCTSRMPRSFLNAGAAYYCFCSPEQLDEERRAAVAAGRPAVYAGTCRNISRGSRGEASDRRAGSRPVSRSREPGGGLRRRGARPGALSHRRHRRSGHRARGRHAGLQLRRRHRRCADGDYACGARRGPHLEHAETDPAVRGARISCCRSSRISRWCWAPITRSCRNGMARRQSRSFG